MTTGRINQVAARALTPLQLGKAHESHPHVHSTEIYQGGRWDLLRAAPTDPATISDNHFALYTYRQTCAHHGNLFPAAHVPLIRSTLGASLFPVSLRNVLLTLPRLDARTCPEPVKLAHGVCLRARARTCACGGGATQEVTTSLFCVQTGPSLIYTSANRTPPLVQNNRIHKPFLHPTYGQFQHSPLAQIRTQWQFQCKSFWDSKWPSNKSNPHSSALSKGRNFGQATNPKRRDHRAIHCITYIRPHAMTDTSLIYTSANRNTPHVRLLPLHASLCVFLPSTTFLNLHPPGPMANTHQTPCK